MILWSLWKSGFLSILLNIFWISDSVRKYMPLADKTWFLQQYFRFQGGCGIQWFQCYWTRSLKGLDCNTHLLPWILEINFSGKMLEHRILFKINFHRKRSEKASVEYDSEPKHEENRDSLTYFQEVKPTVLISLHFPRSSEENVYCLI